MAAFECWCAHLHSGSSHWFYSIGWPDAWIFHSCSCRTPGGFANQAAIAIHNAHLLQQAQGEIAERKQAEVQLRVSEERFRQLADNIQEAFWMTDAESEEEIYISPAAETIWERPLERLLHEPNRL